MIHKAAAASLIALFLLFLPSDGKKKSQYLVLGNSKITISRGAVVGTQIDRVIRDVRCSDSKYGENDDPFRVPNGENNPFVGYMEGKLTNLLKDYADIREIGLTPTYAKRKGDKYFASDGNGGHPFEVNQLRMEYHTVAFSPSRDYAIMPDTHGFHMVAGQAIRINQFVRLSLVMACMDQPAKAEAALFLARSGINCYAPCDRYAAQLIGYRQQNKSAATIIGTAPIRPYRDGAVIGDQPVHIGLTEKIVVQNSVLGYPDQYCDTPWRYFTELNRKLGLNLNLTEVLANVGETGKVAETARLLGAKVVGVRVHNQKDAEDLARWLKEDSSHRAILFHSAAYEPGYKMLFDFPEQTSFGDLNPVIE
jgi:hypothetical protein